MKALKPIILILLALPVLLTGACKAHDGTAPTDQTIFDIMTINPAAIIVPKSTTFKVAIMGIQSSDGKTESIVNDTTCTSSNPIVQLDKNGNLTNSYTGAAIQKALITCTYKNLTQTAEVTVVPAVLESLLMTKINMEMGPGQSQSIKVYGNFRDTNNYVFALDMTNFITWSSNNSAISQANLGTVSSGITGVATITASFTAPAPVGLRTVSTTVTVSSATTTPVATPRGPGLLGSYYDFGVADPSSVPWSASTIGDPFERLFGQRIDSQVYFDWATGINNLGQPYYFGIRWTGRIYIPTTGNYTFFTRSDDGVRLWINDINGAPVINNWTLHAVTENSSGVIALTGGQFYDIKMDYFENAGYAVAELSWQGPGIGKQLIPQIYLFPE